MPEAKARKGVVGMKEASMCGLNVQVGVCRAVEFRLRRQDSEEAAVEFEQPVALVRQL